MKMKKLSFCLALSALLALAALLAVANSPTQGVQSADAMLGQAIHLEEVKGDLEAAIDAYKQFLAKYGANESLAATAQLHIGICYEKLGLREARNAYQQVIDGYPQQRQQVAQAKERLAALPKVIPSSFESPTFTKIEFTTPLGTGNSISPATLSPDGQRLAFISGGSVWTVGIHGDLQHTVAGPQVRLTKTLMQAWGQPSWSQDGSRIAFNAIDSTVGFPSRQIFVVSADGGEPERLPLDRMNRDAHRFTVSLSPDAQHIAYVSSDPGYLHIASIDSGETRQFANEASMQPVFSPDGTKLAYLTLNAIPNSEITAGSYQTALWIRPMDGGMPIQISSTAHSPVWSPDGYYIAFFPQYYMREPMRSLLIVPLDELGRPTAAATSFQMPFQSIDSLAGWSSNNEIGILAYNPPQEAIFTVPASGGRAVRVSPSPAHDERQFTSFPRWSPDGKRIYIRYVAPDATSGQDVKIAYIPAGGGEIVGIPIDPFPMEALPGGGNDISPDGKSIAFAGYLPENDVNIYTVPAEGGIPIALTNLGGRFPCWSPDGRIIAFVNVIDSRDPNAQAHIYTVPGQGGEINKITSEQDQVLFSTVAWSPDGSEIAYFAKDRTLRTISPDGGISRIVAKLNQDLEKPPLGLWELRHHEMTWSPDSKKVAYTMDGKLWVVEIADGQPRLIDTALDRWSATKIDWSPDGRTIAFTGSSGDDRDLWLMSDFLPLVKR